jgi:hypothetical protein
VDLAGSERVKESGVSGSGLADATNINLSLFHLIRVVQAAAKADSKKQIVPYKDSKLTFLLKDAIGGTGCLTTVIATVSPAFRHCRGTTEFSGNFWKFLG